MTVPYEVSIVIPTLDEDAALAALLKRIRNWPRKPREVIVVDGASRPEIRALCERQQASWLPSVHGRGVQLMKGAAHAKGSTLWFIRPDSEPDAGSLDAIAVAIDSGAVGGYFRFRFSGHRHWYQALLERAINLRCRWGVPYGDQGIFATREFFDVCGGFAPTPLFEEVPLVKALRRQGRFDALPLPIGVSQRRWDRDGWWRRILGNRLLAIGYVLGVSPARLARWAAAVRRTESNRASAED
jgi:rSAM/selenodomain-associated transferase 2